MEIIGFHHIKLTVNDLTVSEKFYSEILGLKKIASYDDFVMFQLGKSYLGITTNSKRKLVENFSEFNLGLDHLAFELKQEKDLKEALSLLQKYSIENSGIKDLTNGTKIITFRDPDNIQLEFAYKK